MSQETNIKLSKYETIVSVLYVFISIVILIVTNFTITTSINETLSKQFITENHKNITYNTTLQIRTMVEQVRKQTNIDIKLKVMDEHKEYIKDETRITVNYYKDTNEYSVYVGELVENKERISQIVEKSKDNGVNKEYESMEKIILKVMENISTEILKEKGVELNIEKQPKMGTKELMLNNFKRNTIILGNSLALAFLLIDAFIFDLDLIFNFTGVIENLYNKLKKGEVK